MIIEITLILSVFIGIGVFLGILLTLRILRKRFDAEGKTMSMDELIDLM